LENNHWLTLAVGMFFVLLVGLVVATITLASDSPKKVDLKSSFQTIELEVGDFKELQASRDSLKIRLVDIVGPNEKPIAKLSFGRNIWFQCGQNITRDAEEGRDTFFLVPSSTRLFYESDTLSKWGLRSTPRSHYYVNLVLVCIENINPHTRR